MRNAVVMGTGRQSEHDGKDESQLISLSDFFNGMKHVLCAYRKFGLFVMSQRQSYPSFAIYFIERDQDVPSVVRYVTEEL